MDNNYTLHIPAYTHQNNIIFLPDHASDITLIIGEHASVILHQTQHVSTCIKINLEAHARLLFTQSLAQERMYKATIICNQKRNSEFIFNGNYCYSINATLNLFLQGEHAQATVTCIVDAQHNAQSTFNTIQTHQAPYTTSNFLLKGLLQDHAKSTHTGMIHIDAQAHHANATLQSRYLLIGNHAQAHAQPQLEVLNREVECFHGSAIGSCNDNDLFYLAARGLDKEQAQKLICEAFLK